MTRLNIPEMSCGHCRGKIEAAIIELDALAEIEFDMEARKIDVETDASLPDLQAAISAAGYESTPSA